MPGRAEHGGGRREQHEVIEIGVASRFVEKQRPEEFGREYVCEARPRLLSEHTVVEHACGVEHSAQGDSPLSGRTEHSLHVGRDGEVALHHGDRGTA